jgi:hypothetical protein
MLNDTISGKLLGRSIWAGAVGVGLISTRTKVKKGEVRDEQLWPKVMVHACKSIYLGGIERRTVVEGSPGKS